MVPEHINPARQHRALIDQRAHFFGFRQIGADRMQPAASAGPSFQAAAISGTFQGVIVATTPTGTRLVKA